MNSKKAIVEGEWVNRSDEREHFTEEFILGPEVADLAQARVIVQNGLLTNRMQAAKVEGKQKYPAFARWRTAQVVSFEPSNEKPENSELNTLLIEATNLDAVPAQLDSYKSPEAKIKALKPAIENEKKRRKKAKKAETVKDEGYVD